ncbi:Myosin-1, partial [Frankliniella fusca]
APRHAPPRPATPHEVGDGEAQRAVTSQGRAAQGQGRGGAGRGGAMHSTVTERPSSVAPRRAAPPGPEGVLSWSRLGGGPPAHRRVVVEVGQDGAPCPALPCPRYISGPLLSSQVAAVTGRGVQTVLSTPRLASHVRVASKTPGAARTYILCRYCQAGPARMYFHHRTRLYGPALL